MRTVLDRGRIDMETVYMPREQLGFVLATNILVAVSPAELTNEGTPMVPLVTDR